MKRSSSRRSGDKTGSDAVQDKRERQKRARTAPRPSPSIAEFDTTFADNDGATPAPQSTTRRNGAAPKRPPAPFLPCHLSMLEALHRDSCDDGNEDTESSRSVPPDLKREESERDARQDDDRSKVWNYVRLFLRRRETLILTKAKATRLRGILEEATLVSKNPREQDGGGGGGGGGGGRETTVVPPSAASDSVHNDSSRPVSLSFITQSQGTASVINNNRMLSTNQKPTLSFTSLTSPSKNMPTRTEQFSPFSFHGNSQSCGRSNRNHNRRMADHRTSQEDDGDDSVKSLNLVTRIMEKRCAVADSLSEQEIKPFLPLVKTVMAKIKELDEALETLSDERQRGGEGEEEDGRDPFLQADGSFWDGTPSQFCADSDDDMSDDRVERVAKIQGKLWLWNLLLKDLSESMH